MTYKFFAGLVLLVVVAVGGYYAWHANVSGGDLGNLTPGEKLSDNQVTKLIARISEFLVVPTNEQPSVTVISEADQLAQQQAFYKDAKDGQVLLVYSNRAIIYDAAANKLVNVGPVVRNDIPAPTASSSASVTPSPSGTPSVTPKAIVIDVLNGTGTAGLAGSTATDLKKNKLFTIGKVGDAKGAYKEMVLVDLTKDAAKGAAVAELAKQLGVTAVTKLPAGESTTTADAVVIVGK
jgi:hypothetical protein